MKKDFSAVTLFKCLADDTRVRILLLITREQELCVCELMWALEASQPKVSRHLALLRRAGLLADRRQGQWVYYRLHPDVPDWALEVLGVTLTAHRAWIEPETARLAVMGDRPARAAACC